MLVNPKGREFFKYKGATAITPNEKEAFRFSTGQQFIRVVDSTGANIAEGYGRYYYLDSVKLYYNVPGPLWEAIHWMDLVYERGLIPQEIYKSASEKLDTLRVKLNNFIAYIESRAHNKLTINYKLTTNNNK